MTIYHNSICKYSYPSKLFDLFWKVNQDNVEDIILFHKWIDFFNFTDWFLISLNPLQKDQFQKNKRKPLYKNLLLSKNS